MGSILVFHIFFVNKFDVWFDGWDYVGVGVGVGVGAESEFQLRGSKSEKTN